QIYLGSGGGIGNVNNWNFEGHLHHLSVCELPPPGGHWHNALPDQWNADNGDSSAMCSRMRQRWPRRIDVPSTKPSLLLLVGILSAPGNKGRRDAIRETWFKYAHRGEGYTLRMDSCNEVLWDARFIIGRPVDISPWRTGELHKVALEKEMAEHGDLINLEAHPDNYYSITQKTLGIFAFARDMYEKVDFVLKTDDDSYVKIDLWLELMLRKSAVRSYLGKFHPFVPIREKDHKWFVSEEEYPDERVPGPEYGMGCGYALSLDLIEHILERYEKALVKPFFLEDVNTALMLEDLYPPVKPDKTLQEKLNCWGFFPGGSGSVLYHYTSMEAMRCLGDAFFNKTFNSLARDACFRPQLDGKFHEYVLSKEGAIFDPVQPMEGQRNFRSLHKAY
ncbi:hypothetical protein CYMTET_7002, partial [Cymbomonas tetramitiformis]